MGKTGDPIVAQKTVSDTVYKGGEGGEGLAVHRVAVSKHIYEMLTGKEKP